MNSADDPAYTERLRNASRKGWRRLMDAQLPYRLHLRTLRLGSVLDVGCGIGRNLINLGRKSGSVGIDPNPHSVLECQSRGLIAYTPEEFQRSEYASAQRFDSLLISHVLEHVPADAAEPLIAKYLPYIKATGRVVLITPQERGYRSDPTHVRFVDAAMLEQHTTHLGLTKIASYSFPLPRLFGRTLFPYNEFIHVATKRPDASEPQTVRGK